MILIPITLPFSSRPFLPPPLPLPLSLLPLLSLPLSFSSPHSHLAETLVKVLRSMGCPSPLQAHQIQGGDYVAVLLCVRWLVTKVLEYRRLTGDSARLAADASFERNFAPWAPSGAPRGVAESVRTFASAAIASSYFLKPQLTATPPNPSSLFKALSTLATDAERAGANFAQDVAMRYAPTRKYRRGVTLTSL